MTKDKIKTIIFDLGGVYFTPGSFLAIEKIKEIYDIKNEKALREIFSDNPNSDGYLLRKGLITIDEFEEKLFSKLGINKKEKKHTRYIWFGSYCVHYGIEELIKKLKMNNYRLLIFSGNIRERIEYLEKKCGFLKYFDEAILSFDYTMNKDDIEFYKELIKHLECEPSEALLVDDEKKNIQFARSLGLKGIHYYYTEKLIEDLKKYNISLDP
ncbi:MAG: HAD-IA family hydrolase [Candidatus Hermodarchaeota archaeon]